MPTYQGIIDSYGTLQTAILDILDRSDMATVVPLWIQLTESEFNRVLRHHRMVKKSYAAGHADDPRVALPTDWLEARNIEINDIKVEYITPDMYDTLRQAQDAGEQVPTDPQFYTYYDSAFEVWPEMDEDFEMTMDYYCKIPALSSQESGTNWLLDDAPDAYFYGALRHSAPFLKDDPRIALWSKLYDDAVMTLQGTSERAMSSGSVLIRRQGVSF